MSSLIFKLKLEDIDCNRLYVNYGLGLGRVDIRRAFLIQMGEGVLCLR